MKSFTLAVALFAGLGVTPIYADSKSADYIVSQTVTKEMFEGAITAQRSVLISAIQHDFQKNNITLPDPERFFDLFLAEFIDEFTESMRAQSAEIYLQNFTSEQLVDIATFFKSDAGQAYIAATPTLMLEGARMGQKAGQKAGQNAGKRLAKRIKEENLIVFEDKNMLDKLLDLLK